MIFPMMSNVIGSRERLGADSFFMRQTLLRQMANEEQQCVFGRGQGGSRCLLAYLI